MIFCYNPPNKYTRIYVQASSFTDARTNKDAVWDSVKCSYYGIESTGHCGWWDGLEEELEEKAEWFADWDVDSSWDEPKPIMIDSHY
jgi:hypothetical protein